MSSSFYQCSSQADGFCRYATGEELRTTFRQHGEELVWLALFLTGDAELANACVVDAFSVATAPNDGLALSPEGWARLCTIGSAIEMQQWRISLLASVHELTPCHHRDDVPLDPADLELLYDSPEELNLILDVLCRAALVLCGIEGYSSTESALMLGVSRTAVETAYCTALESLEILTLKMLIESQACAQPCC